MNRFFLCVLISSMMIGQFAESAASSSQQAQPAVDDQQTLPFAILIDNEEAPDSEISTVTRSFNTLIDESSYAFLASDSIVYNYLVRSQRQDPSKGDTTCCWSSLDRTKWDIYKVEGTQFTLFVPKSGLYYREAFNVPSSALELIPSAENLLARITLSKASMKKVEPSDLRAVFKTKKPDATSVYTAPKWNIIIHGHGSEDLQMIVGVSGYTAQQLLKFFNKELNVGYLFLESCSMGGKNRSLMEFDQDIKDDQILMNLNYILIIGSVDNGVTFIDNTTPDKWRRFFQRASDKSVPLSELLIGLLRARRHQESPHASSNIPQVWIPGGYGFQTYNIDKEIMVLSKVMVQAHEDEDRPIVVPKETRAVLLYPEKIQVPVFVEFGEQLKDLDEWHAMKLKKNAWQQYPSVLEMIENNTAALQASSFDPHIYPELKKYETAFLSRRSSEISREYPKFISMISKPQFTHKFTRIVLPYKSKDLPIGGVMHFIRDSFIEPTKDLKAKPGNIYIAELEGENDLLLLLELQRFLSDTIEGVSPLEQHLRSFPSQRITLYDVFINKHLHSIRFVFEGREWFHSLRNIRGRLSFIERQLSQRDTSEGAQSGTRIYETLMKKAAIFRNARDARQQAAFARMAYNEDELKWQLNKFANPAYLKAFQEDDARMQRLHASSGVEYYNEIMQRYPSLQRQVMQSTGAANSSQQKQSGDEIIEPFPAHYMEKFYADFFSRSRIEAFGKNSSNVARLRATANKNPENEKYRTLVEELDDVQNDRMTHREIVSQVGNIVKNPAYVEHLLKTPIFVPRFARAHENRPTVESETLRKALVQGLEDYKTVTPDYEKKRALINALVTRDNSRQPELLQLPAAPAVELLSDAEMMNYFRSFFNRAVIQRALANKELVARIVATAQNNPGNSTYAAVAEELDDVQNDRITHREIVSQVENIVKNPAYVAHLLKTPVFVPRFARAHEHKPTEASEILRQRLVQGLEDYKAVTPDYEAKKNMIDSLSAFAG